MPTPNTQILVRRLPGLPGREKMQFETPDGKILWTAPLDDRISNILHGRWSCTLLAYNDGKQMEILGEAPPAPQKSPDTPPDTQPTPKPPHTLRLAQD